MYRSTLNLKSCLSLGKQVLGDEVHFVMMCPQCHEDRKCLETRIVNLFPNVIQLSVWNKFIWLLSQQDKSCLNLVANLYPSTLNLKSCLSLGKQVLGDEVHFVMMCPQFHEDRKCLETRIVNLFPNVIQLSVWNKFIWLLSQQDKSCLNLVANLYPSTLNLKSCLSLGKQVLGGEVHFVMMCPQFHEDRKCLETRIVNLFPNVIQLSVWNKFIWLLSQQDKSCLNLVANLYPSTLNLKSCLSLGKQVLGDEVHFVMMCPQFHEDRKCLETRIVNLFPNVIQLSVWNKFIWLLSQQDKSCLNLVANLYPSTLNLKSCLSLGKQVLGDEVHFVMMCPQFHEDRKCLETRIVNLFPNVIQLSVWNKFIWLLSQQDKSCLNLVANLYPSTLNLKSCLSLGKQVLGDEVHFVMMCPQFHEDRKCLETRIVNLFLNVIQLSVWNKFIWLLSQEDKSCLNLVANFLLKCFRLKSEFSLQ